MKKQGFDLSRNADRAALGAAVVGAILSTLVIAATETVRVARAQPDEHFLDVYTSKRGAPLIEMRRNVRAGPFPDLPICYTVGALSLDTLGAQYPNRDFMGRCDDGDLLDMRQMYDRTMQMLREEPKP